MRGEVEKIGEWGLDSRSKWSFELPEQPERVKDRTVRVLPNRAWSNTEYTGPGGQKVYTRDAEWWRHTRMSGKSASAVLVVGR